MSALYVMEQGSVVCQEGERIVVRKAKETLQDLPVLQVEQVVLYGNVHLTTPAVKFLLERGIDTVFLSQYGHFRGRLQGALTAGVEARKRQYERFSTLAFCLPVAQAIVHGKIGNQMTLCQRRRIQTGELRQLQRRTTQAPDLDSLRGLEGTAARLYFEALGIMLKDDWGFQGRVRRPPGDPVNVLLSLGYTFLFKDVLAAINLVGLDPYMGVLHAIRPGHAALASDLMEELRTPIVEVVVLKTLNRGWVRRTDFKQTRDGLRLSARGFQTFAREYQKRMETPVSHPDARGQTHYRRILELQARRLVRTLTEGGTEYLPFPMPK